MIDFRHETFLALCRIRNYTKTAEALFITQPAVSQHIKYLEELYCGKLFYYQGKNLMLTSRGEKLLAFTQTVRADSDYLRENLCHEDEGIKTLDFGATLTIGEFICPTILEHMLVDYPSIHINMQVENTFNLLQKLRDGKLNFLLIEGSFDKSQYAYQLFSKEELIAVCGTEHEVANKNITLNDLLSQRIILREQGSGTRDIFEQALYNYNLSLHSFSKVCEIGNLNTIKYLVSKNHGITFIYRAAVERELENGSLVEVSVKDFQVFHEFNFVYLKNTIHKLEYAWWFQYFLQSFGHLF